MKTKEINRTNKSCNYFPCHSDLEDCTFCYCPFYPCLDAKKGNFIYSQKIKKKIWACQDCNWIHKKSVVNKILNLIRNNKDIFVKSQKVKLKNIGIIILAHGSKLEKANKTISDLIKNIKTGQEWDHVLPAYLQFNNPTLTQTIEKLITKKCNKIIIVPFFLFNGNHVTFDIPEIINQEKKKYKNTKFIFTQNIGSDNKISEILINRINEVMNHE
ncbi:sirohydrochlorin cobaltochelatase [Candidatus Poribacteria bacterium]|nr:sirohydrochlorin cobaltochelatase [Candidatus Poribacteria bacterium]